MSAAKPRGHDEPMQTREIAHRELSGRGTLRTLGCSLCFAGILTVTGCLSEAPVAEEAPEGVGETSYALSTIDCAESSDTGYTKGTPFAIKVVTVDGKKVEKETANAYYVMAQAAAAAGVNIKISSGFRTNAEQTYFYNCYINCNCNNCNLAAKPGYSNHQSGHALDLNTSATGVLNWLNAHGATYGFSRTVPSEAWHWEWWGGGPGGGPCTTGCTPSCQGSKMIKADCSEGDCAAFGATCANDSKGLRCVSVFCPAVGTKKVCLDDKLIGDCTDGGITTGDCSAYGAYCSTAGSTEARCVSVFCVPNADAVPAAHDVCLPDGRLGQCDGAGALKASDCAADEHCVVEGPGARCVSNSVPTPDVGLTSDAGAPGRLDRGINAVDLRLPGRDGATIGNDPNGALQGGCQFAARGAGNASSVASLLLLLLGLVRSRRRP